MTLLFYVENNRIQTIFVFDILIPYPFLADPFQSSGNNDDKCTTLTLILSRQGKGD